MGVSWEFFSTNLLNWQHGSKGKGYMLADGSIHTWRVDETGAPTVDQEYNRQGRRSHIIFAFNVDPDGSIREPSDGFRNSTGKADENVIQALSDADAELHKPTDNEFDSDLADSIYGDDPDGDDSGHLSAYLDELLDSNQGDAPDIQYDPDYPVHRGMWIDTGALHIWPVRKDKSGDYKPNHEDVENKLGTWGDQKFTIIDRNVHPNDPDTWSESAAHDLLARIPGLRVRRMASALTELEDWLKTFNKTDDNPLTPHLDTEANIPFERPRSPSNAPALYPPGHTPDWTKVGAYSLEWEPGNSGKGLVTENGDVHTWNIDNYGEPHHLDKVPQPGMGYANMDDFNQREDWLQNNCPFTIDPQGKFYHAWRPDGYIEPKHIPRIQMADYRLKPANAPRPEYGHGFNLAHRWWQAAIGDPGNGRPFEAPDLPDTFRKDNPIQHFPHGIVETHNCPACGDEGCEECNYGQGVPTHINEPQFIQRPRDVDAPPQYRPWEDQEGNLEALTPLKKDYIPLHDWMHPNDENYGQDAEEASSGVFDPEYWGFGQSHGPWDMSMPWTDEEDSYVPQLPNIPRNKIRPQGAIGVGPVEMPEPPPDVWKWLEQNAQWNNNGPGYPS